MTKSKKKSSLASKYIKAQIVFARKNAERQAALAFNNTTVSAIAEMDTVISLGYDFRAMCNPGSPFYIKG